MHTLGLDYTPNGEANQQEIGTGSEQPAVSRLKNESCPQTSHCRHDWPTSVHPVTAEKSAPMPFDVCQRTVGQTAIFPSRGALLGQIYCALTPAGEVGEVAEKAVPCTGGYRNIRHRLDFLKRAAVSISAG
jgi:hypothetical protein